MTEYRHLQGTKHILAAESDHVNADSLQPSQERPWQGRILKACDFPYLEEHWIQQGHWVTVC